jgi:hypothetical protein
LLSAIGGQNVLDTPETCIPVRGGEYGGEQENTTLKDGVRLLDDVCQREPAPPQVATHPIEKNGSRFFLAAAWRQHRVIDSPLGVVIQRILQLDLGQKAVVLPQLAYSALKLTLVLVAKTFCSRWG